MILEGYTERKYLVEETMSQTLALKYLEENHERFQNELIELLHIPSISHDPAHKADMDEAAQWLANKPLFFRCL